MRSHGASSSSASSSAWVVMRRASQPWARAIAAMSTVERRPRAGRAGALGEAVHDRVAAVAQDDEQHAAPYAPRSTAPGSGRARSRRRRPPAPGGRPRQPQPDRGGQREAEHPHRADEPAAARWPGCGRAAPGRLDGVSSTQDRVAREALGQRVPARGPGRAARPAPGGAGRCVPRRRACRARRATARRAPRRPRRGRRARPARPGCGAPPPGPRDHRQPRACVTSGPWSYGYWRSAPVPTTSTASYGASARAAGRGAPGRCPANSGWSCGKPAAAPNGSWKTGQSSRSASAIERRPSSAPSRRPTIARRSAVEERRQRVDRGRVGGRGAQQPLRAEDLVRLRRGRGPVVHRHDHERRAAARSRPRGRRGRSRPARPARAPAAPEHRVRPREPVQPAGQERLLREVAAVLLADDHHQRRAVQARGGDRRDRVAEPGRACAGAPARARRARARTRPAIATTEPSCSAEHEAQVLRQAGQERHLGRARVGEDRRQLQPAQDVERGVADGHARTALHGIFIVLAGLA